MNGRGVGSCWRAVCLLEECHLDACDLLVLGLAASYMHVAHVLMLCGSCVCVWQVWRAEVSALALEREGREQRAL